jgi:hypothetical protein
MAFVIGLVLIIYPLPNLAVKILITNPLGGYIQLTAFVGLGMYILIGVIAVGLTALFYYYFEVVLEKPYQNLAEKLAWIHIILRNVGTAGSTWLAIIAGILGNLALLTPDRGGWGFTIERISEQVLAPFVAPVGIMILVTVIGVLAGGFGFFINYYKE